MSKFKRYQSKVFWGQMESLDSAGPSFLDPLPLEDESSSSRDEADVTVVRVRRSLEAQKSEGASR